MYKFYIETGLGLAISYVKEKDLETAFKALREKGYSYKYHRVHSNIGK